MQRDSIAPRASGAGDFNAGVGTDRRQEVAPDSEYELLASSALSQIEELQRANRRKDEVLAMLAHELRSPLAAIQSAVGILRESAADAQVLQRHMQQLIDRQVRQMARLVSELLDASRIISGQLRLRWERIDLHAAIDNAIETVGPQIKQRQQRLTRSLRKPSLWLVADADRLEQVFVNLLVNASKYSEVGGEIRVSLQLGDQGAVVRVRDFGLGIAPNVLPHIFELFAQCDPAAAGSGSGLGVGLALVRAIVELHGGNVTAESAGPGHGSEFIVRLPCRG